MNAVNLSEIRNENRKAPQFASNKTHEAMISKTQISARKWSIGVNYWTVTEIAKGTRNVGGQNQILIAPLYA